jgi:hypothetical protein
MRGKRWWVDDRFLRSKKRTPFRDLFLTGRAMTDANELIQNELIQGMPDPLVSPAPLDWP